MPRASNRPFHHDGWELRCLPGPCGFWLLFSSQHPGSWSFPDGSFFLVSSIFYWLCYYNCPILFSPLLPSALHPTSNQHCPRLFISMGHTCKFFGFAIFHTILHLPLFLYPPFMLLVPGPFPPFSLLPIPADNPPCDLHSLILFLF